MLIVNDQRTTKVNDLKDAIGSRLVEHDILALQVEMDLKHHIHRKYCQMTVFISFGAAIREKSEYEFNGTQTYNVERVHTVSSSIFMFK